MSWRRHYFKGKKVWVQLDDDGEVLVDDGRVNMRYQNSDDAKIYRAHPSNVSNKPADRIDADNASRSSSSSSNNASSYPATDPANHGPRMESTTVPDELCHIEEPADGLIEIHTDGACSGNPGPCGYGAIIRDGFHYLEISQFLGHGTNNIAELTAIKVALETLDDTDRTIHLYTDSSYAIGVLTKGWKAKANRQLILSIRRLVDQFSDLHIRKVKGHSGDPLNERADDLATSSLKN